MSMCKVRYAVIDEMRFLPSLALSINNIRASMLITEQSLTATLDGREGHPRRRRRLFIRQLTVFIGKQLLFILRSSLGHLVSI